MTDIPYGSDLALADHYVAQTRRLLAEQARHIQKLTMAGHDTAQAEETFRGMWKTLRGMQAFREHLLFELLDQYRPTSARQGGYPQPGGDALGRSPRPARLQPEASRGTPVRSGA